MDMVFCTSLYWHLYALGDDSANQDASVSENYTMKRIAYLRFLSNRGRASILRKGNAFGEEHTEVQTQVLQMFGRQNQMWKQKMKMLEAARHAYRARGERNFRLQQLLGRTFRKLDSLAEDETGDASPGHSPRAVSSRDYGRSIRLSQEEVLLGQSGDPKFWTSPLDPEVVYEAAEDVEMCESANGPIVLSMRVLADPSSSARGRDTTNTLHDESHIDEEPL